MGIKYSEECKVTNSFALKFGSVVEVVESEHGKTQSGIEVVSVRILDAVLCLVFCVGNAFTVEPVEIVGLVCACHAVDSEVPECILLEERTAGEELFTGIVREALVGGSPALKGCGLMLTTLIKNYEILVFTGSGVSRVCSVSYESYVTVFIISLSCDAGVRKVAVSCIGTKSKGIAALVGRITDPVSIKYGVKGLGRAHICSYSIAARSGCRETVNVVICKGCKGHNVVAHSNVCYIEGLILCAGFVEDIKSDIVSAILAVVVCLIVVGLKGSEVKDHYLPLTVGNEYSTLRSIEVVASLGSGFAVVCANKPFV